MTVKNLSEAVAELHKDAADLRHRVQNLAPNCSKLRAGTPQAAAVADRPMAGYKRALDQDQARSDTALRSNTAPGNSLKSDSRIPATANENLDDHLGKAGGLNDVKTRLKILAHR